jgi:DNA-binding beta-propeller fold protein YncE
MQRAALLLAALLAALVAAVPAHAARDVVFVANAEGGTVSVVDARRFVVVGEIDVLPDGPDATLGEDDPLHSLIGQRLVELAGGNNYAQDQDVSPDGRTLYVSRGHRGDVAAFDIASGRMLWKLAIPGLRADHMTLSADGRQLYVSALTENRVVVVDTERAAAVGSFPTGEWPHDNHFSHDGERLYNASIGNIVAPEAARGSYAITIADPETLRVLRRHEFDRGIRPFAVTGDETRLYAQLSLFHGVVEVDPRDGRELRRMELPVDEGVTDEDYDFEAPHHGLALSHDERTLCLAGRASDYVALVATDSLAPLAIIDVGDAPGWAENGPDGRHCFVPNTREDTLSVISYADRREVARLGVGDGPKHIEAARLPGGEPELRLSRRCTRDGRVRAVLGGDVAAVRDVSFKVGRRLVARDTEAPFERVLPRGATRRSRARLRAVAYLHSGDPFRVILSRTLPRC